MSAKAAPAPWVVVSALGTAQTLGWASSYYLAAILAAPMATSVGVPPSWVFGAFSGSLLVSAALGPWAGRTIDRLGGRPVLAASSLVFAAGLVLLAVAPSFAVLCLGWAVLGAGMALGLYEAAFATLAGLYGREARGPITGSRWPPDSPARSGGPSRRWFWTRAAGGRHASHGRRETWE